METINISPENGVTFECFSDSAFMLKEIWEDGAYDIPELPSLKDLRVLDVGANQGFFSIYAARQGAHVYSYEPDPENFRLLTKNVFNSGFQSRISFFRAALAEKSGEIELFKSTHPEVCSSATISTSRSFFEKNRDAIFKSFTQDRIRAVSLDEAMASTGGDIDLLKIDCEGSEYEILRGASPAALRSIRWIAMETHPGYEQKDLVGILEAAGFSLIEYQKPMGPMYTGVIKAAQSGLSNRGLARVVSMVRKTGMPQTGLSGEGSFAIGMPKARLAYAWTEAGKEGVIGKSPLLNPSETVSGPRKFTLSVFAEGLEDTDETVWAASDPAGSALNLGPREVKSPFSIPGPTRFRIPKELFPKTWAYSRIIVQVSSVDSRHLQGSAFISGATRMLHGWHTDLPAPGHPDDSDLFFELHPEVPRKIEITWWAEGGQHG